MCPSWSRIVLGGYLSEDIGKQESRYGKTSWDSFFTGIDPRRRNMRHLMIFVCNRWHCVWVVWQNLVLCLRFLVLSVGFHPPVSPRLRFPFCPPAFLCDISPGVALRTQPWHQLTVTSGWHHPLSQPPHQSVRINLSRHRKRSKNTGNSNAVTPNLKRFVFVLFHFLDYKRNAVPC